MPVRFIPVSSPYDCEKSPANSFTLSLSLLSIPEVKTTTITNDEGEKLKEKTYVKGGVGKAGGEKLCSGSA